MLLPIIFGSSSMKKTGYTPLPRRWRRSFASASPASPAPMIATRLSGSPARAGPVLHQVRATRSERRDARDDPDAEDKIHEDYPARRGSLGRRP